MNSALGEQPPGTLDLFNQLLPLLGDVAAEAGTVTEAQERWKTALAHKTCLLIIDDVWQASALQPFLEGGPGCRRLVTTRNDGVLPQDARRIVVDAMSKQEAMTVVTQGLVIDLGQSSTQAALAELVAYLGCWPLLLSVAHGLLATQLRYGRSLLQALEVIRQTYQGQQGVSIQSSTATGFRETVERSLTASFRQLQEVVAAHYQPVQRYGELAIFPEDTDIPIAALRLFWRETGGMQQWETDDLCMQLASLSLVVHCDLETGTIRLHDVTRDFLLERAGSRLPSWQIQFLEAVSKGLGIGRWAEVASSNIYLWQHLVWHLCQAERWAELQTTLTDLGFLTRKALYQGVWALEADLVLVRKTAAEHSQDATLVFFSAFHRRMVRLSHLLRQTHTPSEMGSVLLSQLGTDPLFAKQRHLLERELPRPYLQAWHPLPEDAASSSLIRTLHGHTADVNGCAVSPDNRFIVSASDDGTLKVWDASSGRELRALSGHSAPVTNCVMSPDGHVIVSASADHTLKVWDASSGQVVYTLSGHTSRVASCVVSPDGRFIVSASWDHTLKVWETSSGRELRTLSGHTGWVNDCAVSPDGRFIVSASADHTLKVWETSSGHELHTLFGPSSALGCAVSSDSRFIVSAFDNETLWVWEASFGRILRTLSNHTSSVDGCAISPDSRFIVSASDDGTLKIWETSSGRELRTFSGHSAPVTDCVMSPNGEFIVSASADHTLKVWDTSSGQDGQEMRSLSDHSAPVTSCAMSPDGCFIISASSEDDFDCPLKVWDASSGRELRTLSGHISPINGCVVSSDGRFIVSASHDTILKIWETSSGRELRTFSGHSDSILGCAVSPDGRFIVSASWDHTLKVWETSSGRELRTLSGHTSSVRGCAVSPDSRFIISTSDDHTLKIWEIQNGQCLLTFPVDGNLCECAFHPDGEHLVACGANGLFFLRLVW